MLENMLRYGLLLGPEIIEYPSPNAEREDIRIVQCRFCMTALEDVNQLIEHARIFGNVHLEFTTESAYEMGATPVMYVPKVEPEASLAGPNSLWHLASSFIHRMSDLQRICARLEKLDEESTKFAR
jgi:hypothetical protein